MDIELAADYDLPSDTLDGHSISLQANIEFHRKSMMRSTAARRASGLYRTEFLYLSQRPRAHRRRALPVAYADAGLKRLDGRSAGAARSILGADKYTEKRSAQNPEQNPFLGDRSIRMCLHDIPMFKTQLRGHARECRSATCG